MKIDWNKVWEEYFNYHKPEEHLNTVRCMVIVSLVNEQLKVRPKKKKKKKV